MCGRYNFTVEESNELREIVQKLDRKLKGQGYTMQDYQVGEVFPTNHAIILTNENQQVEPSIMKWGYPGFQNKGVIINARSETAFEKKTFRESLMSRRCIIPARSFYEWDKSKVKYDCQREDATELYMAGLYAVYEGETRFVILTTEANTSMSQIHHRMPLILEKTQLNDWLLKQEKVNELLHRIPCELELKKIS